MIKQALLVFLGGGAGSVLRFAVGRFTAGSLPGSFPWGTFLVNVTGSLAAGLLFGLAAWRAGSEPGTTQLLFMTGFLGGFTTFSAFSMDVVTLAQRNPGTAAAYVVGTLALSLLAAFAGLWLARGGASPL